MTSPTSTVADITHKCLRYLRSGMGLGHVLGLDDGSERWLCGDCGRMVTVDADESGGDEAGELTCPNCGSDDLERVLLL